MDQIVDISTDKLHLSRDRGFLKVSDGDLEVGRVPFDQIASVLVHAHGITWTNSLLVELSDRGVPVVLCGSNHNPRSVLMPLEGHHAQGGRIRAQWQTRIPLLKQAWKQIIISKISMQAATLEAFGKSATTLHNLIRKVTSGDSTNLEAQAARIYWPTLMGKNFKRDTSAKDANALLNYGYTVLRSATMRSVVGAELHPSIGVHHSNRTNAFSLADDLVEPFRPLVDCAVLTISQEVGNEVTSESKRKLAGLIAVDLPVGSEFSPVSVALSRLATSLGKSFENKKLQLSLPRPPDSKLLVNLGK